MNISIENTLKSITAATLLSLAFDNPFTVSTEKPVARITAYTFDFDESIKSPHKLMVRSLPFHQSLSAVGLVWKHYGLQILERLGCVPENSEIVWRRIDRNVICKLDTYYNTELMTKERLELTICQEILTYGTHLYLQPLLQNRGKDNYIEIDNGLIPWREEIVEYNRFTQQRPLVEFVVYPLNDEEGNFCVESVKFLTREGISLPVGAKGTNKNFLIDSFVEDIQKINWD